MNKTPTRADSDTELTRRRSGHVRYRITDGDGRPYAPFRLKPGVSIAAFVAKYIPIEWQYDWSVTEVRS